MDGGQALGGVGRPQAADDGLRRVVGGSEEGDVTAVCKTSRRAKLSYRATDCFSFSAKQSEMVETGSLGVVHENISYVEQVTAA